MNTLPILTIAIHGEHDVVLVRQRARTVTELLGFSSLRQTRFATAVSEIVRNAQEYAGGGKVELMLEREPKPSLLVRVSDRGPGIEKLEEVLDGSYRSSNGLGMGIVGARRLMERFEIRSSPEEGTVVLLGESLPDDRPFPRTETLEKIAATLAQEAPDAPFVEVLHQNQELLRIQSELLRRQRTLTELNRKLEDADTAKDRFLAMLGHELRNLLGALNNALEARRRSQDPEVRSSMDKIAALQVEHLTRLVDDLLDASKISEGKLEIHTQPIDLVRELPHILEPWREDIESAGLALRLDVPKGPLWVDADPTRLAQILGNLLSNGRKFTDPGGSISVVVEEDPNRFRARITVTDTGCGLDPDALHAIFEPFAQTAAARERMTGGLGLGLAIVKALVEAQDGQLEAASAGQGQGSTLSFDLPMTDPPSFILAAAAQASASDQPLRILLVDDHEASALGLSELLKLEGHRVEVCHDSPSALKAHAKNHPEVVVCDLGLPGMDGFAVARELRGRRGGDRLRLVALSGFGDSESRHRALDSGFDVHLTKPVDLRELLPLLRRKS